MWSHTRCTCCCHARGGACPLDYENNHFRMMTTRKTRTSSRHQHVHASYGGCRHSQIRRNSNCSIDTCSRWLSLALISGFPLPCVPSIDAEHCASYQRDFLAPHAPWVWLSGWPPFGWRGSFRGFDPESSGLCPAICGPCGIGASGSPAYVPIRESLLGRRAGTGEAPDPSGERTSAGCAGWGLVCSGGHASGGSPSRPGAGLRVGAPPGIRFRLNGHLAYSSAGNVLPVGAAAAAPG